MIYAITRVQSPWFVRLARRYFNTAGVGVCFQSKAAWERIFSQAGFAIENYSGNVRWDHGVLKRLMFVGLFLKIHRHGHFALAAAPGAAR